MNRSLRFQIDEAENLVLGILWETDADGTLERKLDVATVGELPPEWAEVIRAKVRETGQLSGEVEVP